MRNNYIISAQVVDSDGTHAFLYGYPKKIDSKNCDDDEKACRGG